MPSVEPGHRGNLSLAKNVNSAMDLECEDPNFKHVCKTEPTCNGKKNRVLCGSVTGTFEVQVIYKRGHRPHYTIWRVAGSTPLVQID
jgi:hypothetical protein